jgi:fructosamine-3-kinase
MQAWTIAVETTLGESILHSTPVHGGDINACYCAETATSRYFIKTNSASRYPAMFLRELEGLEALARAFAGVVPQPLAAGEEAGQQWLILPWLEKGHAGPGFWEKFGQQLAALHRHSNNAFGWPEDNYIGSLIQKNDRSQSWGEFYASMRIMPLVQQLAAQGALTQADLHLAESLCHRLETCFSAEPPALLHGDLWGGNFMVTDTGQAAIYDPAVYFGHREMDLGMTLLFGGFDARFYAAYREAYPLEAEWKDRIPLTQLYPLLVHAVLFGVGYVAQCRNILRQFA